MYIEEGHTLVGHHFRDGVNTEILWAKKILLVIWYIFVQVTSDGVINYFGHSTVPIKVQVLKKKLAIWYSVRQYHRLYSHYQKQPRERINPTPKDVFYKNIQLSYLPHPKFLYKKLKVQHFEVTVVVPSLLILELNFPHPTTWLLSEVYHLPIMYVMVSKSIFHTNHQF